MKPKSRHCLVAAFLIVWLFLATSCLSPVAAQVLEQSYEDTRELSPNSHKEYLFFLPKGNTLNVDFNVQYGGDLDLLLITEDEMDVYLGNGDFYRFNTGSVLNTEEIEYTFTSLVENKYYLIVENSNRTADGAVSTNNVRYHIEFEIEKPESTGTEQGSVCGTTVFMLSMLPIVGIVGLNKAYRKKREDF